jgi:ferritin-like metal-binding protein YciE
MKGVKVAKIETSRELFVHKLGSTYKMENKILDMLEELIDEAQRPDVKDLLQHHRQETQQQVRNLERAFEALGEEAKEQPCPTIEGIEKDGKANIKAVDESLVDAVILGGAADTEHHEISTYNGLIMKAEVLGEEDVAGLLRENLEQEEHTLKEVDQKAREVSRIGAHVGAQ